MRNLLLKFFLLTNMVCFNYLLANDNPKAPSLVTIDIQATNSDDVIFAQAASGLIVGTPMEATNLQTAIAAIQLTDRFRAVTGQLVPKDNGVAASIVVDPWPAIKDIGWHGDAKTKIVQKCIHGLRPGMHLGDKKLTAWSLELQNKLIESGYPNAQVVWARAQDDQILNITIELGIANIIKTINIIGDISPYTADQIQKFAEIKPNHTIWSVVTQQLLIKNLRTVLQSHKRYEASIALQWENASNTLNININLGPKVTLLFQGGGISWFNPIKKLIPLSHTNYSSEILDEGDRRILHFFQNKGYLDVKVQHYLKITRIDKNNYNNQEVTITYSIDKGNQSYLNKLHFHGNASFTNEEIQKAINITPKQLANRNIQASPNYLDNLELRVKAFYLSHGYASVAIKHKLERRGDKVNLIFKIQEGPKHLLQWLKLKMPSNNLQNAWTIGECLALIFTSKTTAPANKNRERIYHSDRKNLKNIYGSLSWSNGNETGDSGWFSLQLHQPIPLVKSDLAQVITNIKKQYSSSNFFHPTIQLTLEPLSENNFGAYINITTPHNTMVKRLIVSGADKTRAQALFRTIKAPTTAPLSNGQINAIQTNINHLNTFQRADLSDLAASNNQLPPTTESKDITPWQTGDLKLTLEEQVPYVATSSLGYNQLHKCQFGIGLTQMNVGGMGRTIDYGIGIIGGTLKDYHISPLIVTYTDPVVTTHILPSLLPEQATYRAEFACIKELDRHAIYRSRLLNALHWSLSPSTILKLGYRCEHANFRSYNGCNVSRVTVSSPFVQLAQDTRDNPIDPTNGRYSSAQLECANQLLFTSQHNGFLKLDLKNQWNWPMGHKAKYGVITLGLHLGIIKLTATKQYTKLPLTERFFAGGLFSLRGIKPNTLGPIALNEVPTEVNHNCLSKLYRAVDYLPTGGDRLILANLEYRFPLFTKSVWGELFVDSGQTYMHNLSNVSLRTTVGCGLILKFGIPIKLEYATDLKQILKQNQSERERKTQLHSILVSVGFQI